LRLSPDEVPAFTRQAEALGVPLHLIRAPDGSGAVRFPDHTGEHCPMLDDATSACRIYADRPSRCREFPEKPRPGCAISEET
jgi:Fe-S-cluster containining protein